MTTSSTRRQELVRDVEATVAGLAGALMQLQLAGAPPDASVAVTIYPGLAGKLFVAADWQTEG